MKPLTFFFHVSLLFLVGSIGLVAAELPRVALFTTGGTIQSRGEHRMKLMEYGAGRVTPDELLEDLPEIHRIAQVEVIEISNVGSPQITTDHLLRLSKELNATLERDDVTGAVVTHGTGTLEETAYFLHLTVRSEKPVVVVGAMRPFSAISRDGPYNLYSAIRIAADPDAKGRGTMVVLNETIHSARFVTKGNTYRVETFVAREMGPLGYVDSDRIVFYRNLLCRHSSESEFDVSNLTSLPQVDIVYGYQEASAASILGLIKDGAKGIIFADSSPAFRAALHRAQAEGIVVVQGDRKGAGRVLQSERSAGRGFVTADNLNPQKARMLLRLALTQTQNPREIQRMFNEY